MFFTLKDADVMHKGIYGSNGFTVLKGSVIAKTSVPSLKWDKKRTNIMHEYAFSRKTSW